VNKQATRSEPGADSAAEGDAGADATPKKRAPTAIDPSRVIDLGQVVGDPRQVVLENDRDPLEVLDDATNAYWQSLPSKYFPVGSRFELTNDASTFLFEVWVRGMFGSGSTGVRGMRFHHRVVWDEREEAMADPFVPTGRWEVRYDGRHYLWRVYRPNGVVIGNSFKDQNAAEGYRRQQEGNPRAR
jgi:hypothetical protein